MNKFSFYEPVILKKDENEINPCVYVVDHVISNKKNFEYDNDPILYDKGYRYVILKLNRKEDLLPSIYIETMCVNENEIVPYKIKEDLKPLIEPKDYKYKIGDWVIRRDIPSDEPIDYEDDIVAVISGFIKDSPYINKKGIKYLLSLGIIYICRCIIVDCGSGRLSKGIDFTYEEQCLPYVPDEDFDFILEEAKLDYEENYKNK